MVESFQYLCEVSQSKKDHVRFENLTALVKDLVRMKYEELTVQTQTFQHQHGQDSSEMLKRYFFWSSDDLPPLDELTDVYVAVVLETIQFVELKNKIFSGQRKQNRKELELANNGYLQIHPKLLYKEYTFVEGMIEMLKVHAPTTNRDNPRVSSAMHPVIVDLEYQASAYFYHSNRQKGKEHKNPTNNMNKITYRRQEEGELGFVQHMPQNHQLHPVQYCPYPAASEAFPYNDHNHNHDYELGGRSNVQPYDDPYNSYDEDNGNYYHLHAWNHLHSQEPLPPAAAAMFSSHAEQHSLELSSSGYSSFMDHSAGADADGMGMRSMPSGFRGDHYTQTMTATAQPFRPSHGHGLHHGGWSPRSLELASLSADPYPYAYAYPSPPYPMPQQAYTTSPQHEYSSKHYTPCSLVTTSTSSTAVAVAVAVTATTRAISSPVVAYAAAPKALGAATTSKSTFRFHPAVFQLILCLRDFNMGLIFPSTKHDQILVCLYTALRVFSGKPIVHQKLISVTMALKNSGLLPHVESVSKSKVRGVLAILKQGELVVKGGELGEAVKLYLAPDINSFEALRERHDRFLQSYMVENLLHVPTSLLGEIVWTETGEEKQLRVEMLEGMVKRLEPVARGIVASRRFEEEVAEEDDEGECGEAAGKKEWVHWRR